MARKFTKYPKRYVRANRHWRSKTECKTKNGKIVHEQNVSSIYNDQDYYVLYDAEGNFIEKSLDFNDLHDKLYGIKSTSAIKASFWKTEVSTIEDIKSEIDKAVAAGTTILDIDDYLSELFDNHIIDGREYAQLCDYGGEAVQSASSVKVTKELRRKIYEFCDDCGGYSDYDQKVEDVMDEFGLTRDQAESEVWNWSINWQE